MFRRVICSIVFIALIPLSRHFQPLTQAPGLIFISFLSVFLNIRSKDYIQFGGIFRHVSFFFFSVTAQTLILNVWNWEAVSWENARTTGMCKPYSQGCSWVPTRVKLCTAKFCWCEVQVQKAFQCPNLASDNQSRSATLAR